MSDQFWDLHTFKKANPKTFSFRVNNIFAKKQDLFDICGLMQYTDS